MNETNGEEKTEPQASRTLRLSRRQVITLAGAMLAAPALAHAGSKPTDTPHSPGGLFPQNLRCEYRINPLGIDAVLPRLSWTMTGSRRRERQTAYQILVASSPQALAAGHADLWDSGRVTASQASPVVYGGKALTSRAQCHWKVRLWDHDGKPTEWSEPALCTIGLLHPADWQGHWIADAALADPANRPRTPIHCYFSEIVHTPNAAKWIVLDLGTSKSFDGARLNPAKPDGVSGDIATILYPVRFRIEASEQPDFQGAITVVDKTGQDVKPPRPGFYDADLYRFPKTMGRYVRLAVSRLSLWDGNDYALALGHFQVFDGDTNIAVNAPAQCSDSRETSDWSKRFLTDPQAKVAYSEKPAILQTDMGGINSPSRVPLLRREFQIKGSIRSATLYSTARGFYEARLNGAPVSEDRLSPGFTEYNREIEYLTYDVTPALRQGPNVLGMLLGYGWYASHMNLSSNEYIYGYFPQFLGQLEIEYADGRREVISSDGEWKTSLDGPIRWSDLLDGEGYDCRREMPGWDRPAFDASSWKTAAVIPRDNTRLMWPKAQPVRLMQEITPVAVAQVAPGVYVFDLGQEIAGYCRLKVDGPADTRLTLRHAETRHADGSINLAFLIGTPAQENYILDGHGMRTLEPHFTYHGFRFVEVTGLTKPPSADTLIGVHLRTSARQVSEFHCSNPLYNKIMNASRWTQQNMLFDIPAGCAARGERLGWTGDIRPCVQTALLHFDLAAFFEKYAVDMRTTQTAEGRFTDIAPHAHLRDTEIVVGSPGWANAGVSLPWELYLNTGDKRVLADNYKAAQRWVDYLYAHNPGFLWENSHGMSWGDWLSAGPATPMDIGASAFFAHDADVLARMAEVLGYQADAVRYKALFQGIKSAFASRYVSPDGIIRLSTPSQPLDVTETVRALVSDQSLKLTVNNKAFGSDPAPNVLKHLVLTYKVGGLQKTQEYPEDSVVDLSSNGQPLEIVSASYGEAPGQDVQGSYALALQFDLLDEPLRSRAVERLVQAISRDGGHPTTGFWSSVELMLALSRHGRHDIAAQMVNLTTFPSWGHMVQGDGTTCWESYDADTHDLSLNHWTHSASGEWLWRHIAGIAPDPEHPGYEAVVIRPRPCAEVDYCTAAYESLHGPVTVAWNRNPANFTLSVTVPPNMFATVFVPAAENTLVMESGRLAAASPGVQFLRREEGCTVYRVESGAYHFVVNS
ncbi:MAG: family 78 glycoside hydrolase catalytic domain [Janthinobacterium lividum]